MVDMEELVSGLKHLGFSAICGYITYALPIKMMMEAISERDIAKGIGAGIGIAMTGIPTLYAGLEGAIAISNVVIDG